MVSALEIAYIIWKAKLIEEEIKELESMIYGFELLLIHIIPSKKEEFNQIKKENIKSIVKKIGSINKGISRFNRHLKKENYQKFWNINEVKKIEPSVIKSILEKVEHRDESISILLKKDSPEFKDKIMREENLRIKINMCLMETLKSLREMMLAFIKASEKFESKKLKGTDYNKWVEEINNIFGIGYPELALFITGRTLEKEILDYMILLRKNKKINKTYNQIRKMSAEDRLNFLKGRWLTEKDYHKIQSIKFDRNIVGHYTSKKEFIEAQNDAESDIKISINLIERIYNKIQKQKRRTRN